MNTSPNISLQLPGISAGYTPWRIDTPNGYFADGKMHYYVKDYQGNVRQVTDADGMVEQDNHYYPYGMLMAESSDILAGASGANANPYLFGAKEYLTTAGANLLDFTARTYDPSTILFQTQDPKAGDYTPFLPYLYCGADPVNKIDPTGKEWYKTMIIDRYDIEKEEFIYKEAILYTTDKDGETFRQNNLDPNAVFLGKTVVVFDGSYQERAASDGTIDGEDAINAAVTVYGPKGSDDIDYYIGFTMTSDFKLFGAIDNGEYDVNYDIKGKSGSLKSHYAVNNRGPVNCLNGVNPSPEEYHPYSSTQKNGVFVHATNSNGTIPHDPINKRAVSTGCPLILGKQWNRFENQIGKSGFKMIINRK